MVSSSRRIRLVSATLGFSSIELIIWLWISCNLATLALAQNNFYTIGRYGKRGENENGLFLAGSRYGRSETANIKNSKNVPKVVEILPRVDRFFVGSRYGKRADIQSYNMACLKCFVAALNYLDRFQHVQLMQREGGINYDKNKEYNDNQENKREFKHNLVL